MKVNALKEQIGGSYYKHFAIQPIEFSSKNKLSYLQGSIIKRICRYNDIAARGSNAGLEDLQKIKHEVDLIIELEGWAEL